MKQNTFLVSGLFLAVVLLVSGCTGMQEGTSDQEKIRNTVDQLCTSLKQEDVSGVLDSYYIPNETLAKMFREALPQSFNFSDYNECQGTVSNISVDNQIATADVNLTVNNTFLLPKGENQGREKVTQQKSDSTSYKFRKQDGSWKIESGFMTKSWKAYSKWSGIK